MNPREKSNSIMKCQVIDLEVIRNKREIPLIRSLTSKEDMPELHEIMKRRRWRVEQRQRSWFES